MEDIEVKRQDDSDLPESVKGLPDRAKLLYRIIREWHGDWVGHKEIVALVKQRVEGTKIKYLSTADLNLLKVLDAVGAIEATMEKTTGPIGFRWKYRAVRQNTVENAG